MVEATRAELKYLIGRQREEINTINEVGRLLRSTSDPHDIVLLVASYLKQTFPIALSAVYLIEQRTLHLIRFAPIAPLEMTTATRQLLDEVSKLLSSSLEEKDVTSVVEDQFGRTGSWVPAQIGPLHSHVPVPLTFNSQVVGLLSVFSSQADAFAQEDIHAIQIVADQLGAALRNALLVSELQRADQLKNDILAIISHELSIPLTTIQEGISLLHEGALGPINAEQQEFLTTVDQNVDRLRHLHEKVLAATQFVTGAAQFTFASADIGALLARVQAAFRQPAEAKGIGLELEAGAQSLSWAVDAAHLTQAVSHLVENAIQATPSGGTVTLGWSASATALEIQVTDTGAGIPEEELPRLFGQFRSLGGIDERKTGGLGLGLFITKAAIDAHGGTVRAESKVGQGARFTIHLPERALPQSDPS